MIGNRKSGYLHLPLMKESTVSAKVQTTVGLHICHLLLPRMHTIVLHDADCQKISGRNFCAGKKKVQHVLHEIDVGLPIRTCPSQIVMTTFMKMNFSFFPWEERIEENREIVEDVHESQMCFLCRLQIEI